MKKLNVLVIGGTGFIGKTLSNTLADDGHTISVISRNPVPHSLLRDGITMIKADVFVPGPWQEKIADFEVIINLIGATIFRRWTNHGKRYILDSRINSARNMVESLRKRRGNVQQFFSVSGVGYYGFHGDEILDENNSAGSDFLAQVASRWEEAAEPVKDLGIRPVILRLGHVLGMQGGALPKLVTLAKLHLASRWGNGEQWISWVHIEDVVRAFLFLLDNDSISGPVNVTSPNPVRNSEMMGILASILGKRVLIPPIPRFVFRLMLGQFSTVFLNGQRVIPQVMQQNGFLFKYPNLNQALNDLIKYNGE